MANKNKLIQYIQDELSAGLVHVELDDDIIERNIERALQYSSDYYSNVLYKTVQLGGNNEYTTGGYISLAKLDNDSLNIADGDDTGYTGVPSVVAIYPTSTAVNINTALLGLNSAFLGVASKMDAAMLSYAQALSQLSNLESILGRNAKVVGDKLFIDNYYEAVTVAYVPEVVRIENIVEGEWIQWIIEYATALCKRQIAQSRGKYAVSSNPSQINAAQLLEEATAELERLRLKLETKGVLLASR